MRNWLKEIRLSNKMKCKDIALKCGFTSEFYTMIEHGKRNPSVNNAKKIASILKFDWTLFFSNCEKTSA